DLIGAADLQMVLQVLAYPFELVAHVDAEGLQHRPRTDARELQDLRAADGPGGQHHLARSADRAPLAVLAHDEAGDASALQRQPLDERAGLDLEVAPVPHGPQEGFG